MKKFQFLLFIAIAAFAFMVGCDSKKPDNTIGRRHIQFGRARP